VGRIKPIAVHVKPKSSLAGDVSSQVFIQFLWRIATGVTAILLARHLSKTDNGLLGTAWQYVQFAQFLTDLGFNTVLVREASAADNARRRILVWTSLRSRATLAAVITGLVLIASFFVKNAEMVFLLRALVFPLMVANMLFTWAEGVMVATERVSVAAMYSLIWAGGNVLATMVVILTGRGLLEYTILQIISAGSLAFAGFLWVKREYPYTKNHDHSMQRSIAAFGIAGFLTQFVQAMPSFILPGTMSFANIGAYQQGYKIPQVLLAIPGGIAKAYFTRMCKAWENDREEHTRLILGSLRFSSLIGGIIGVGLCVAAPEVIQFLYGKNKWPLATEITLAITAFVPWVILIATPLGDAISSTHRYVLRTQLLTVQVVSALVAYLILPRMYGIVGVGISIVLLEVIMLLVYLIVADPVFKWRAVQIIVEQTGLLVAATVVGFLIKPWLHFGTLPLLTSLAAGSLGAIVFVLANLVINQDLRGMVLGRFLKRG
jgi:O-antigen/teichoic acid export membrane protein